MIPATPKDIEEATTHLITACEMGLRQEQRASAKEKQVFARLMAAYEYTQAELILAMREVPRDPERFGGSSISVQDVERVVKKHRQMRARLKQQITARIMGDLLTEFPELDAKDFHVAGYDDHNNAMWRYVPNVKREGPRPLPVAVLDEPGRPDTGDRVEQAMKLDIAMKAEK